MTFLYSILYLFNIESIQVSIYYNMILAWTLFYLVNSFTAVLPWSHCDNWWNTANCFDSFKARECSSENTTYFKGHCFNVSRNQSDSYDIGRKDSPAEEYFNNRMLKMSDGFENMGQVQWELLLCLFFAWCGVFFCLMQGIKTTGKVVYFTALFPYIVLIILLGRAVTLQGVTDGLIYYVKPDWEKLIHFKVWKEAFLQIFYSLGPAFGSLMTISSYNSFHHDFYKDGLIVGMLNSATSIFAGFVVFSILGFMAHELNTSVDKVIRSGHALAFVAYPTAITRLAWSPFWSVLFFLMLVTIGLDSQFAMVETVLTTLYDGWPRALRPRKILVSASICFLFFLIGIPQTMNGGIYLFSLIDNYSAGWPLLFISLIQCAIVSYIYGIERFLNDIETMLGYKVNFWWKLCWKYISPVSILILLLYDWASSTGLTYGNYYTFPPAAIGLGWSMALLSVSFIPGFLIYKYIAFIVKNNVQDTDEPNIDIKGKRIWNSDFRKLFLAKKDWNKDKGLATNTQINQSFSME
ncbi:sodium- and chloride-dependent glycine transporter 2-like isoform X1 [Gordionus sp. m RMFG-2023]|uniref:sodium- and chloride-dependent glycine transporter 2-like isoform X1 n=1 Tax=Gordionus sp. m RMFG-2023 TaxID=3053472 RepID=UPI0031FBCDC6